MVIAAGSVEPKQSENGGFFHIAQLLSGKLTYHLKGDIFAFLTKGNYRRNLRPFYLCLFLLRLSARLVNTIPTRIDRCIRPSCSTTFRVRTDKLTCIRFWLLLFLSSRGCCFCLRLAYLRCQIASSENFEMEPFPASVFLSFSRVRFDVNALLSLPICWVGFVFCFLGY